MLIELHVGVELEIDQRWRSQAQSAQMALKVCHVSHSGSEFWRVGVLRHWEVPHSEDSDGKLAAVSRRNRSSELDICHDANAGPGMCQRVGVGNVRHLELRYLWVQGCLRLRVFRLREEAPSSMTAEILAKYGEWSTIEQHCESLNLRFPTKLQPATELRWSETTRRSERQA